MNMLVSVVIPTYNRAPVLGRAIESVLSQSHAALELIVVDDGSDDGSGQVLSAYENHPRVRILSQKNLGVAAARNLGIGMAQGELIALLDSDDYWLPGKLEGQVHFLAEGGWDIVQTDETWIRNGRRVNPMRKHAKPCGWIFQRCLHMCLISPSCVLFTRRMWELCGPFDESLPACEDFDLWLRATSRMPVGFVPEKQVVKTGGHGDQLSRSIIGLDLYRIYALSKLLRTWDLDPEQRELCIQALCHKEFLYRQGCIKRGKYEEAQRVRELVEESLHRS